MRTLMFFLFSIFFFWSRHIYADVSPNNYVAYKAILNTLTLIDQVYVKLDGYGRIDKDLINQHSSVSENFNSLKSLVNDKRTIEIIVANEFRYKDKNGSIQWGKLGVTYSNELESASHYMNKQYDQERLKEMGFKDEVKRNGTHGITLFPGGERDPIGDGKGAEGDAIVIVISSDLTERDAAKTAAHEANGHALFFVLGKDPNHAEGKTRGDNRELEDQIETCVKEAEMNFDAAQKKGE
jgi:hypothetical protein